MPDAYLKKISANCRIPLKLCEKFWEQSKKKVQGDNWGLVVHIFKSKCRKWLEERKRKICDELL